MYCKNCGTELPDETKFCCQCGANQDAQSESGSVLLAVKEQKNTFKGLKVKPDKLPDFSEAASYCKDFFSADPTQAISAAAKDRTNLGILALVINILVFPFSMCNVLPQILTYSCNSLIDFLTTFISENVPMGGSYMYAFESQIPTLDFPATYSLFFPFVVFSLFIFAIEFAGIYIPLLVLKRKPESVWNIVNVIAVSTFPLTVISAINFLIALVYPPLTVITLAMAIFVHILMYYEGTKEIVNVKMSAIWRIGLSVFAIGIIFYIVASISLGNVLEDALNIIIGRIMNGAADLFDMFW